jgi:hypothetical protein
MAPAAGLSQQQPQQQHPLHPAGAASPLAPPPAARLLPLSNLPSGSDAAPAAPAGSAAPPFRPQPPHSYAAAAKAGQAQLYASLVELEQAYPSGPVQGPATARGGCSQLQPHQLGTSAGSDALLSAPERPLPAAAGDSGEQRQGMEAEPQALLARSEQAVGQLRLQLEEREGRIQQLQQQLQAESGRARQAEGLQAELQAKQGLLAGSEQVARQLQQQLRAESGKARQAQGLLAEQLRAAEAGAQKLQAELDECRKEERAMNKRCARREMRGDATCP